MYQEPEIKELSPKQLAGIHVRMSLSENRSFQLWSTFMPRRREIRNRVGDELFSLQVYETPEYFRQFNPEAQFEKWAAVEVTSAEDLPAGIEPFRLEGGRYAIFIYRGLPEAAGPFFQWIFSSWLPASGYRLDDRPHFEILGSKYKHGDPASEEEVWIPIK